MAKVKLIAKELDYIGVRFYKSRSVDTEGQEFATVSIDGKSYRHCIIGNDGVTEGIVEWMNHEILGNPDAVKKLHEILEANDRYSGASAIHKYQDGTLKIKNKGENTVFALLEQFGIKLKADYSSQRSNAYLVGYEVENEGVEI